MAKTDERRFLYAEIMRCFKRDLSLFCYVLFHFLSMKSDYYYYYYSLEYLLYDQI